MRKLHSVTHLGYVIAVVSIFVFSYLLVYAGPAQFTPPEAAAPDNGRLNDLSDIDGYLKKDRTTLQTVDGPLRVNSNGALVVEIGTDSSLSVGSVPGSAVYGLGVDGTTSAGIYGYAEGANAVGLVAGVGDPFAYAGTFVGPVAIFGDAGGGLVTPFNNNGAIVVPDESIGALAMATDDQFIYIVGHDNFSDDNSNGWRIEKRDKYTGVPDIGFGSGGFVEETGVNGYGSDWNNIPNDIVLDDTYMYIVGYDANTADDQERVRIEKRRKSDGMLDSSFDLDGYLIEPWAFDQTYRSPIYSVAIDKDAIYLAGQGWRGARVEKHFLNGHYDSAFDGDACSSGEDPLGCNCRYYQSTSSCSGPGGEYGAVSVHAYEAAYDLAIDDDKDVIYVLNRHTNGTMVIEKRNTVDGTLDTTFGAGGLSISSWSNIHPWDIAIGPSKIYGYVLGYEDSTGYWHLSKWRLDTGQLCNGLNGCTGEFGTAGEVLIPSSMLTPYIYGATWADKLGQSKLAVDSQGLYIAGGHSQNRGEWQIQKRDLSTGDLITSFGVSGEVRADDVGLDEPFSIIVDEEYIFVSGFTNDANDWRIEKRFKDVSSGNVTIDGYAQAAQFNGASSLYSIPGVVSLNGIRLSGTPEMAVYGSVDTGYGYGIYGYSPTNRGILSIVSVDNAALLANPVYNLLGITNAEGDSALVGYAAQGNGIEARVGSTSTKYAAYGESTGLTPGESYGVYGVGGYFGGYFGGEVYVDSGGTITVGDIVLTETGLQELLTWCGDSC